MKPFDSIKLFIVHNNEIERLDYLDKKLNQFKYFFEEKNVKIEVCFVGPNEQVIIENRKVNSYYNRILRALYITKMYYNYDRSELVRLDESRSFLRLGIRLLKNLKRNFFDYKRSIKAEQETLYAHIHCIKEASKFYGISIVFESDIIFFNNSARHLYDLINYINNISNKKIYCDLAGGCDRRTIMNSWAFCPENIHDEVPINDELVAMKLPMLVNNTAGGYLLNQSFAEDFGNFLLRRRWMCPIDFCFNLFSQSLSSFGDYVCIHLNPPFFEQGSSTGVYSSNKSIFEDFN